MTLKQKIIIRPPKLSDAKSLLEMINSLVEEKAMITIQEKQTIKDEKKYLINRIKNGENHFQLFLIIDGEVMGNARITRQGLTKEHVGQVGITLKKEARGRGLGEKLLKEVIKQGTKKFKFKIITLEVISKNKIAQNLYKKLGFKNAGVIKGGARHYDKYEDVVTMVKYLK